MKPSDKINFGRFAVEIRSTPGHTNGNDLIVTKIKFVKLYLILSFEVDILK